MNTYKTPTTMKNSCTLLAIFLAISTQLIVAQAHNSEGFISEEQNENAAIAQAHKVISRVKRMGELDEELFVDDMDTADSQHYPVFYTAGELDPPTRPNFQPIFSQPEQKLDRQRREENLISLTAIDNEDMNAVESRQYNALPVGIKRPTPPPRPNKLPPRISERIKRRENGGPARRTGDVQGYDPRSNSKSKEAAPTPKVYAIPPEFLNQVIPFNPSSQIEKVVNGVPTVISQGPKSFQPQMIFRDDYPSPTPSSGSSGVNPPYPPVPYHDSRNNHNHKHGIDTSNQVEDIFINSQPRPTPTFSNSGSSGIRNGKDSGIHYISPPTQGVSTFPTPPPVAAPVPEESFDSYVPQNNQPISYPVRGSSSQNSNNKPKLGYFPPNTRVMPRVNQIEAECRDDFMKLRVAFNDSFTGLIYSAGYTHDHDCMYINGTGENIYEFYIQLNRCGTLGGSDHHKKRDVKNREPTKNYMWNTVTIQYNSLIEEEWDEHFKVTCEYGYDFWKTVTFPFLEVETNTADPVVFTLTPPECHMEIKNGYGTSGTRISGPVHVGDPITLLIYMRSAWDGFDILVNDCVAHNGANKKIQLIDHNGCPVDEKLIAKFQGTWNKQDTMYETVVFAHMKTFRFTGTPALYIECDVRMCHGKCPTQPCNWRDAGLVRKRRSLANSTIDLLDDNYVLEDADNEISDFSEVGNNENSTAKFSESLSLFQSLQVLANEEEELAFRNQTTQGQLIHEGEICLSNILFTTICGAVSAILLITGVSITLLCCRVRQAKGEKEQGHHPTQQLDTFRSRASSLAKSEYIHSPQARIP